MIIKYNSSNGELDKIKSNDLWKDLEQEDLYFKLKVANKLIDGEMVIYNDYKYYLMS